MTKYRFKDGFECEASTKEEAKELHKSSMKAATASSEDNMMKAIYNAQASLETFEENLEKSVQALNFIKEKTLPVSNVKEYVKQIQKYLIDSGLKDKLQDIESTANSIKAKPYTMQDWKEFCLDNLPSTCSLADAQLVEEKLEELCH